MPATTTIKAPQRSLGKKRVTPASTGTPDPRAVTDYAVALSFPSGNLRLTVTLSQPCVVRAPRWGFIDTSDGSLVYAPTMVVVDNRTFYFQFAGEPGTSIGFIEAPYQDTQVQNFQGGFVRPSATWFRKPM